MHFDNTINIGNVVSAITFLILAGVAWTDLRWRIRNLESWRKEHQAEADKRDATISNVDKILYHITNGREGSLHG